MRTKRTLLIFFILTLILVASMMGMVACLNDTPDDDTGDDDDTPPVTKPETQMKFEDYMDKVNAGMLNSKTYTSSLTDYHVKSQYDFYTSVENYTLTYEAVYKQTLRDGIYYLKLFDSENHINRLTVYYDSADLYVTAKEGYYVIKDFSSFLLFDVFIQAMQLVDLNRIFYHDAVRAYFTGTSLLASVFAVKDCTYTKVSETRETVSFKNGDLSILMSRLNALIENATEDIGTSFDSASMHYLGFKASKLFELDLNAIIVQEIAFLLGNGRIDDTAILVDGRMLDNSKYFIKARYAYDETTKDIEVAKELPTAHAYENIRLGKGSYDGTVEIPEIRDSEFNVSLDYDLNAIDNTKNQFTFRIYDQLSTATNITSGNKYTEIKEFCSVYYANETLYINTTGMYDYVHTGIALSMMNLPKVYITDIDITNILSLTYTRLIRIMFALMSPMDREENPNSDEIFEELMLAISSNVEEQEISILVTESLIKAIRGDDTDLSIVFDRMAKLEEGTINKYFGGNPFEVLRGLITYNFGTKLLSVELIYDQTSIALFKMKRIPFTGVVLPADLNELIYSELVVPERITADCIIQLKPYGAEFVDVSGFLGAFVGDSTGKNTPYIIGLNEYILVKGKISEEYVNINGEKRAITRYSLSFSKVAGEGTSNITETPIMDVAVNPANIDEMLVKMHTEIGDYKGGEILSYRIERRAVNDELAELTPEGTGLFSQDSMTAMILSIFGAVNDNTKVYLDNGYYCVSMTSKEAGPNMEHSDPIAELIGIENAAAVVKMNIGFGELDLSNLDLFSYTEPYINKIEGITTESIYSTGSRWKETVPVYVGTHLIEMILTYDESSIEIKTGQMTYTPTAHLFGQDIQYTLNIINEKGTRKISGINYENNLLVIDPAYTKTLPEKIAVRYDNSDTGEIEFIVDESKPFSDKNITQRGFNMALLDKEDPLRFANTEFLYTVIIGQNSIAQVKFSVFITVINREVKPLENLDGVTDYTTHNGVNVPVVAEFTVDPYTYAMQKRIGGGKEDYDIIADLLETNRTRIDFENLYGYKKELNDKTQIEEDVPCYYDVQGYNWFNLSDIDMHWDFDTTEITWQGGIAYAYGYYGDYEKGHYVPTAVRLKISKKEVSHVQIDTCEQGTYLIDYLIKATYDVPTTSGNLSGINHTVRVYFEDGTYRTVTRTVSQAISEAKFNSEYIYGELAWENIEVVKSKISVTGTGSIFGTEGKMTDSTRANFFVTGSEHILSSQTVPIRIVIPSRDLSLGDLTSKGMIIKYDEKNDYEPIRGSVSLNKAYFYEPENKNDGTFTPVPFEFEPYNVAKTLPNEIWLYVKQSWGQNALSKWQQYPVQWVTTNDQGEELNLIAANVDGNYILAHPVTEERDLVVYGKVGDGDNGGIWIVMYVRNQASEIKEWHLYLPDGTEFDISTSVSVDPYLSYLDRLPDAYMAVLESGSVVTNIDENGVHGGIKWFVTENGVKYPIFRADDNEFMASRYNTRYDENGYYIFSKNGSDGTLPLEMKLVAGGGENDIGTMTSIQSINLSVQTRSVKEKLDDEGEKISDYIDIFDRGYVDGQTYTAVGNIVGGVGSTKGGFLVGDVVSAGYVEINYYVEDSQILLDTLLEIQLNNGYGYCGILLNETKSIEVEVDGGKTISEVLYAKRINWHAMGAETLSNIINALRKQDQRLEFRLYGVMDEGNRNQATVELKITIYDQTLSGVEMINADEMTSEGIYFIKNDENKNGVLSLEELNVLTKAGYVAQDGYKKFFNSASGYTSNASDEHGFKYVIYFNLDYAYSLSKNVDKTYTSPYEYYEFLFDSLELSFASGLTRTTQAVMSLGERDSAFFNKSVLGVEPSTQYGAGVGTYSFIVLEKLSKGSAIDRTLVIIDAQRALRLTNANTITENGFDSELNEIYNNDAGYRLPTIIDIQYKRVSDEKIYTVKYNVSGWYPDSESATALGTEAIKSIPRTRINVRDGVQYRFIFDIPDIGGGSFYQAISFMRTDASLGAYVGQSKYDMYTIRAEGTEGLISIENAYSFFFRKTGTTGADVYTFNTDYIPVELYNLFSRSDAMTAYVVEWTFTKLEFDESIFTVGTSPFEDNKIKIAEFIFGSYYAGGESIKQILNLYVTVEPMEFYGIEKDGLTILSNGGANGENALLNVIQIDPYKYKDSSGTSGRFTLPTTLTVLFNGGTQTYTFKNSVKYRLMGFSEIRFINFNENGHTLVDQGVTDPSIADVSMYIPGYSINGIDIIVQFLERKISNALIENRMYTSNGTYKYKTDAKGNIVYENGKPVISTYSPLASFTRTIPGIIEDDVKKGTLPIYYIDPYNTATYELPTKGTFEFITEPGVYGKYDITGWQYYNPETQMFMDMEKPENADEAKTMPFYSVRRVGVNGNSGYDVCYYNPVANGYQGGRQIVRGYITVGGSSQYFEVLLIVLTRKLRVGVSMNNSEYVVNFDFDDPISAMVGDIPSVIGENAFVDYDMYYKKFDFQSNVKEVKDGVETITKRLYEFEIAEEDYYSRHGSNEATIPGILWCDGFDYDGDGKADADFTTFTTTGFTGEIAGDVYFGAGSLNAKLDYYDKTYGEAYTTLAKALVWDELFGTLQISNAGAQEAINKQKKVYDKAVINETYDIVLANLDSDELIQYLGTTLIDDFREKATPPEGNFNLDDPEEERAYNEAYKLNIVPLIYENICEEYVAWKEAKVKETTGKVDIYLVWEAVLEQYKNSDVTSSGNISANQILKAQNLNALLADATFGMNEQVYARIDLKTSALFIEIHADMWRGIYGDVTIYETERLDDILEQRRTALGENVWYSTSWEMLVSELDSYTDLGIKGEKATAEVTVPVISYNGMDNKEIVFNKFNFDSIETEFTVKFILSYEDIYNEIIEDATIETAQKETEANAQDIINKYVDKKTQDAINSIAPKISVNGNEQVIPEMTIHGEPFNYEWWFAHKDDLSTPNSYYGGFWDGLYAYSVEEALYYVMANVNVTSFSALTKLANSTELLNAWADVLAIFNYLQGLEEYLYGDMEDEIAKLTEAEQIAYYKYRNIYSVAMQLNAAYEETKENFNANYMNTALKLILALSTYIVSGVEVVAKGRNTNINWSNALINYGETIRTEDDEDALPQHERLAELAVCMNTTETDFYADLAPKLILAEDTNIQRAMQILAGEDYTGTGTVNGAARMFALSYGENGYYVSRTTNIALLVKEVLDAIYIYTLTDGNGNPMLDASGNPLIEYKNEVYNVLCNTYADPSEIVYRSMKNTINPDGGGTELMNTANAVFEFITGYVISEISPYDVMLENVSSLSTYNFNAEYIETLDSEGKVTENCLLYYAMPSSDMIDAVIKLAEKNTAVIVGSQGNKNRDEWIQQARDEVTLQLKRMTVFNALKARTSGADANKMNEWENTALHNFRVEAVELAFKALKAGNDYYVDASIRLESGLKKNVSAFGELINKRLLEKDEAQAICDTYINDYIDVNLYTKSRDILEGLSKELNKATPNGTVLKYFGRVIETQGYLTMTTSSDDGYPVVTTDDNEQEADELLDKLGTEMFGDKHNEYVRYGYMKDYLLQAFVEYYEKDATAKQREIIAEIINYYTGFEMVDGDGDGIKDLRETAIAYIKNQKARSPFLGQRIYSGLEERKDMGVDYLVKLGYRYYDVYLNTALASAQYMVERKADAEISLTTQYNIVLADYEMLLEDISGNIINWSSTNDSGLTVALKNVLKQISVAEAKTMIFEREAKNTSGSYNTQKLTATESLNDSAYVYAYEQMYDLTNADGEYVYRDDLEAIILAAAEEFGSTATSYKQVFETVCANLLGQKTEIVYQAIDKAVRVKIYEAIYDTILLFDLTGDEFMGKMFEFVYDKMSQRGKNIYFDFGTGAMPESYKDKRIYFFNMIDSLQGGISSADAELFLILDEWWNSSGKVVYGNTGTEEKTLLEAVYMQCVYQAKMDSDELHAIDKNGTLSANEKQALKDELRHRVAMLTMLDNIYRFLGDIEKYQYGEIDEGVVLPEDYFAEENEAEKKAFVITGILDGNLMFQENHSLSLAQANFSEAINGLIQNEVSAIIRAVGELETNVLPELGSDFDKTVNYITKTLAEKNISEKATDADKIAFSGYLAIAQKYVEITSIGINSVYMNAVSAEEANPIRYYVNEMNKIILGKDLNGIEYNKMNGTHIYTDEELESMFGMLPMQHYIDETILNEKERYETALAKMLSDRDIDVTFVSEDVYKETGDGNDRHVIYFDRHVWEEFAADTDENKGVAKSDLSNSVIQLGNPYKMESTLPGHLFTTDDITFKLGDLSKVEVKFEGVEEYNTLIIDALKPELPEFVSARGYINETEFIDLGKIPVKSYSEAFYQLIYKQKDFIDEDANAFILTIDATSNITALVRINVKYLDREVKEIYLEDGKYMEYESGSNTKDDKFKYSMFKQLTGDEMSKKTRKENVLYIDPTNPTIINASFDGYLLPTTIGVRCGNDTTITEFNNVEWEFGSTGKLAYSLSGTQGYLNDVRLRAYSYIDDEENERHIEYNYKSKEITMRVYDGKTSELKAYETYTLAESSNDMVDWNISVYIKDKTVNKITVPGNGDEEDVVLGEYVNGVIDATHGTFRINPYYPEYPETVKITFNGGEMVTVNLENSDWILSEGTALDNIALGVEENLEFNVRFKYRGYDITVKMLAMDIMLPHKVQGTYFNGGTIYIAKGQDTTERQLKENYSVMYYNFGDEGEPNWQKVNVLFSNSAYEIVSTKESENSGIYAAMGVATPGAINNNIEFTVKVVDLAAYALLDEEETNKFVEYNFYPMATDDTGTEIYYGQDAPDTLGDYFSLIRKDGSVLNFKMQKDLIEYDFELGNERMIVPSTYSIDEDNPNVDKKLGFDANGSRMRTIRVEIPMVNYKYSNVPASPEFNTDETGKRWTWTTVNKLSSEYVDAIYWPLGRPLRSGDLPTVFDEDGNEISLRWDLTGLNVNKANIATPGTVTSDDGTVIVGYYLSTGGGLWKSKELKVYISKQNVTDTLISSVTDDIARRGIGVNGRYVTKTYDGQFFDIMFNASKLLYTREDGSVHALPQDSYIVEYMAEDDERKVWRTDDYPLDAGVYYVRIRFEDYNVYITTEEEWLLKVTVNKQSVDLGNIMFDGENSNGQIIYTYTGERRDFFVTSGLPQIEVDNWFEPGEKFTLYSKYFLELNDETKAAAKVYDDIRARVSYGVRAIMDSWYEEVRVSQKLTDPEKIKAFIYNNDDYMPALGKFVTEIGIKIVFKDDEGNIVISPVDVGTYYAEVTLDNDDPESISSNYVPMANSQKLFTVIINRDDELVYQIESTTLTYTGRAINPRISGLHNSAGSIPAGVTIKYTYTFGDYRLVVVNRENELYINTEETNYNETVMGIKNVGEYQCTINILGGENFRTADIPTTTISIRKATVYIEIGDIIKAYLDEVEYLQNHVKIYSDDYPQGVDDMGKNNNSMLLAGDKLSILGYLDLETAVQQHFELGTYYTYINGLKKSDNDILTYTYISEVLAEMKHDVFVEGDEYRLLKLKGATLDGNLYKYGDEYQDIIDAFNNYYIYVKTTLYEGMNEDDRGAAGTYKIDIITGTDGALDYTNVYIVGNKEDLSDPVVKYVRADADILAKILASVKDGDTVMIYLSAINETYDAAILNADATIEICGYYKNETHVDEDGNEIKTIGTKIGGLTINKGSITLKIVSVNVSINGVGIYLNDKAGALRFEDSEIICVDNVNANTVGIYASVNYAKSIYVNKALIKGLNAGIEINSSYCALGIDRSTFENNYFGVSLASGSKGTNIKETMFSGHEYGIRSESSDIIVLYSEFEYNRTAIILPQITNEDMRTTNIFHKNNNENMVESNLLEQ